MGTEAVLDLFGMLEGTDKSSQGHGYLRFYEEILRHLRQEHFTLIEIGVLGGGSLRCWKAYFPNAQIIGIDINPDCKRHEEDRIRVEIGSQDDTEFLDRVVAKNKPLIVIDDGSHMAHHMIATFERLFPALLPGGYYFFEDAYVHYGTTEAGHIGLSPVPLKDYCANLATSRTRGWLDPAMNHGVAKYIFEHTASVAYLWRAILIQKTVPPVESGTILRTAERIASESGLGRHWYGLAEMALAQKGEAVLAETAARAAIRAGEQHWQVALCLVKALEQQGRIDDATAEAERALSSYPDAARLLEWMGLACEKRGDHVEAGAYFRRALERNPDQAWFLLAVSRNHLHLGDMKQALEVANHAEELAKGTPIAVMIAEHRRHVESLATPEA